MQIGELSKKSGFSRDTIRFYEKMGLIKILDEGSPENCPIGKVLREMN